MAQVLARNAEWWARAGLGGASGSQESDAYFRQEPSHVLTVGDRIYRRHSFGEGTFGPSTRVKEGEAVAIAAILGT